MVSSPRSFIDFVGYILFPRRPKDLSDESLCPACFVELPTTLVCSNCHLDLNHPDAARLRNESLNVVTLLDSRLELIGKIRFETTAELNRSKAVRSATTGAATTAATSLAWTESTTPQPTVENHGWVIDSPHDEPAFSAVQDSDPGSLNSATTPNNNNVQGSDRPVFDAHPARSHSGIQVLLLIIGVSLLAVGAIFFLIFAFLTFGLLWRSAIIASITIASIVGASKVKDRGLSATAEALSALAVVFVVLDIYALRANDLLVIGDPEGRLYWGGAMLIASLGFMLWHRARNLILVNIVGFVMFPPAAALLAAGITADQNLDASTLITVAALAVASLIHTVAAHGTYSAIVERSVAIIYAMLAFVIALISGTIESVFSGHVNVGIWMLVLAALAAMHSVAASAARLSVGLRNSFAVMAGLLLGTALWIMVVDDSPGEFGLVAAASTAVAVVASLTVTALLVEASGRRFGPAIRSATFWGSIGVWCIAASATLFPLSQSVIVAMQYVGEQALRRTTSGTVEYNIITNGWPQLTLVTIPIGMAVLWTITGQLRSRIHVVIASAGLALSLSAPLTGTLLTTVIMWLALTATALVIIAIDRKRRGVRRTHLTIAAGGLLPLLLAYSSSWSSHETWAFTTIATALLLVAARYLVDNPRVRAALLGTAALVLLLGSGGVGEQLQFSLTDDRPNSLESWLTIAIAAVAMLALSLWRNNPTLQIAERHTLWWISLSSTTLAGAMLWNASVGGAPSPSAPLMLDLHLISVSVAIAVIALLGITMVSRNMRDNNPARYVAAALLAPTTVWALDSASRALGLTEIAIDLAPATASVLVGALSMALRVRNEHTLVRRISELSALTVAGLTATDALVRQPEIHWLIILLVSIALLLTSIAGDGIFGSTSPRRHLIWAAVALGTWALWLRLDQSRVDSLDAYVLPLASVVLVIAIFIARAEFRDSRLKSAPALILTGLLIAILPLSLNAASGNGLRTLVIAGLCGALLLIASFLEPRARLVDFWGVAIVASAIGLIVATASRAIVITAENRSALPELDSWLLGAVALLALASFGLATTEFSRDAANARWSATSEVLLGAAIVLFYAVETLVLINSGNVNHPLDNIRIFVLVAVGGALLLLSARPSERPLTRRMSYLAFGLASVVGAIAYFGDLIRPLEWVTVTLGAALVVHGTIRMMRDLGARSLPSLSSGLTVVLIPSLIATFIDTDSIDTTWRIIALGIACVLAIVAGTWLKLQAPLLFGAIVVLIHAAHTFAPAIVSLYQLTDWWIWAVVGGAIVLFLGITLERRIRDLTLINTRFSALR